MTDPLSWPHDPASAALILDFDGTLAPIVDDPAMSRMPASTAAVLERLIGCLGRIAIVSGRPAAYLNEWAGVPGVSLVGLYGLERVTDGAVVPHPDVAAHADSLRVARAAIAALIDRHPGVELEDKGNAFAVHWRRAVDRAAAEAEVPDLVVKVGATHGLRVEPGKLVAEIRPPVDTDKGAIVRELAAGFDEVAFAGDDLGDLPALAAARELGGLAIAVDHGAETADAVRDAGDLVVDGPEGFAAWLTALATRLS